MSLTLQTISPNMLWLSQPPIRQPGLQLGPSLILSSFITVSHPEFILTNGETCKRKVIKELCSIAGIKKSRTTPYHAMGNGCTERFNHTLLDMLRTFEEDQKRNRKRFDPRLSTHITVQNTTQQGLVPSTLCLDVNPD